MTQSKQPLTFILTVEEANFILNALQELPGRICNPLSAKIKEQAQVQLPKEEVATAAE